MPAGQQGQAIDRSRVPFQRRPLRTIGQIPEADSAVVAGGDQRAPVGGEYDEFRAALMRDLSTQAAAGSLPQEDLVVLPAGRGDRAGVGRDAERADAAAVQTVELADHLSGG